MLSKFRRSSKDTYNIVTGDESWIYHFDPKTKEQLRVWWNTTQCLSKDIKEGKKQQPRLKKGHLLLYHENALAHRVATKVNFFFSTEDMQVLPYPTCSPHLENCDNFFSPQSQGNPVWMPIFTYLLTLR